MEKKLISIPDLDFEYKLWKNRISFYANEIKLVKARLAALKLEFDLEVESEIELLKLLNREVDVTLSEIKIQEEEITCFSDDYPINKNHSHYLNHKSLQQKKNDLSMEFIKLIKKIEMKFGAYILN
jgi:hypothetical protein